MIEEAWRTQLEAAEVSQAAVRAEFMPEEIRIATERSRSVWIQVFKRELFERR